MAVGLTIVNNIPKALNDRVYASCSAGRKWPSKMVFREYLDRMDREGKMFGTKVVPRKISYRMHFLHVAVGLFLTLKTWFKNQEFLRIGPSRVRQWKVPRTEFQFRLRGDVVLGLKPLYPNFQTPTPPLRSVQPKMYSKICFFFLRFTSCCDKISPWHHVLNSYKYTPMIFSILPSTLFPIFPHFKVLNVDSTWSAASDNLIFPQLVDITHKYDISKFQLSSW